jgi:hypothetical protein
MDVLVDRFIEASVSNNFPMLKMLHDMDSKVSMISLEITPSNCCKSTKEQTAKFTRLNEALRLDVPYDLKTCVRILTAEEARNLLRDSEEVRFVANPEVPPTFAFKWKEVPKVSKYCSS